MEPLVQKILVIGGNGFVGSAVCRLALARGFQVTSISSSGRPYTTPKGHSPAWTSKVDWQKADALQPKTYKHLLPGTTAVVHTLGTLLEDARYKAALSKGDIGALIRVAVDSMTKGGNPLEEKSKRGGYDELNRDAALHVCEAFMSSAPDTPLPHPRAFVYVSAEDIFRPFIPARYIESKREAELGIERMMLENPAFRSVFVRPSLIYHPHFRPLTSPVAALLDLSASLHTKVPQAVPTPSGVLRTLAGLSSRPTPASLVSPSPLDSVANALTIPPIHVDHVAEAICIAADNARGDVSGVVDVREMRRLIGWTQKGQGGVGSPSLGSS
ncbi:uncharacterized protein PHACADRAFT_173469 [Phanerochaete carnosa HHB-10118-sp]|uniref:NAD-dependent epimerase/dehydratase domain-containing protein n=1 Tax=Phanerochaete carnosa (strain HHB-10118-sp) TaxID=650164 RepID=K5VV24_PHACS|nr:uncharacterized protein PHACADRAFT_173469 [Phanerochaete carnosa HHB-10118-sp]EKM55358.1 hypothetical protein PHACADRAFT_173469 [Phanerochaete carnosa HHB-10118-sp]